MLERICFELCGLVRFDSAEQIAASAVTQLAKKPADFMLCPRACTAVVPLEVQLDVQVEAWHLKLYLLWEGLPRSVLHFTMATLDAYF